jgi:hypothetical protein
MDCTANLPRQPRKSSLVAVAIFVMCLALQSGYSEESAIAPEVAVKTSAAASRLSTRPFSHIAVGINAGSFGVGAELATPLSRRTNLRVDGDFMNYSRTLSQDGISYNGNLRLRNARVSYDVYPFGGGFRLSAGVAVYNQFNVKALANVPSSQTITFNDVDYYSSTTDPLHGNASIAYSHKVAPALTFGWGNAIPRSGRHLSFPVEIGAAFTGTPSFNLAMAGSACSSPNPETCQPVNNYSDFQSNLTVERNKINNDLEPLRFYPIINLGVTYRF